jgi:hypothetical protein
MVQAQDLELVIEFSVSGRKGKSNWSAAAAFENLE